MNLGEESGITSEDPEQQQAAIQQLQQLVGQHFPAGVDGSNAIESLKGVIEDPELFKRIKAQASEDPDSCVRGLVKDWLELNAPEALEQLDFGDYVDDENMDGQADVAQADPAAPAEDPAAAPAPEEVPQEASDANHPEYDKQDDYDLSPAQRGKGSDKYRLPDPKKHDDRHARDFRKRSGKEESMNVQEVAEFIHSFYDRDSGTFPKGPEGVAVMVGKKFGEQAEHVARKMVERMAPQQSSNQNPELAELSRIRELSGISQGIRM
jgi:hypothetical protein